MVIEDIKIEDDYRLSEATYVSKCGKKRQRILRDGSKVIYEEREHHSNNRWGDFWGSWKKHRTNGPAVIEDDVEKWYQRDVLHREDGPASHDRMGRPMYRLWGKKVSAYDVMGDSKDAFAHAMVHEGLDHNGKKIMS